MFDKRGGGGHTCLARSARRREGAGPSAGRDLCICVFVFGCVANRHDKHKFTSIQTLAVSEVFSSNTQFVTLGSRDTPVVDEVSRTPHCNTLHTATHFISVRETPYLSRKICIYQFVILNSRDTQFVCLSLRLFYSLREILHL